MLVIEPDVLSNFLISSPNTGCCCVVVVVVVASERLFAEIQGIHTGSTQPEAYGIPIVDDVLFPIPGHSTHERTVPPAEKVPSGHTSQVVKLFKKNPGAQRGMVQSDDVWVPLRNVVNPVGHEIALPPTQYLPLGHSTHFCLER